MASPESFFRRVRSKLLRFWRTEDTRLAVLRDVLVAGGVVLLLLAGVWLYAGQPISQAPVVSVESGSMMHGPFSSVAHDSRSTFGSPPFGRIGTIDPGDIVFVKDVDVPTDIEVAFGTGSRSGYGGHGDVIVFKPNNDGRATRVIHRAMLFLEVGAEGCRPNVDCLYRIPAFCQNPHLESWSGGRTDLGKYCQGSEDPLDFRLERGGLVLDFKNPSPNHVYNPPYPCGKSATSCPVVHSGFFTKGDNNPMADQLGAGISAPVRMDWIIGKARGEIPWFGLIKLAFYGNAAYHGDSATGGGDWKILGARAPSDIWISLGITLGVLISIPMIIDLIGGRRARKAAEAPSEEARPPSD